MEGVELQEQMWSSRLGEQKRCEKLKVESHWIEGKYKQDTGLIHNEKSRVKSYQLEVMDGGGVK